MYRRSGNLVPTHKPKKIVKKAHIIFATYNELFNASQTISKAVLANNLINNTPERDAEQRYRDMFNSTTDVKSFHEEVQAAPSLSVSNLTFKKGNIK